LFEEQILAISEREQRRIGQDLHDGLCQQLAGIEFRNSVLVQQLAKQREAKAEAGRIGELIRDVTRQARLLAKGLSPMQLECDSLMSALEELTSNASKLFSVCCRFACPQPVLVEDNTVATHLYRIAQEAITNAVRHGPRKIHRCEPEQLRGSINVENHGQRRWIPGGREGERRAGLADYGISRGDDRSDFQNRLSERQRHHGGMHIQIEPMTTAKPVAKGTRVLIVDDHPTTRAGLVHLINRQPDLGGVRRKPKMPARRLMP
jgi:nitrate/nitrite-specific signal transduction histidine kinase